MFWFIYFFSSWVVHSVLQESPDRFTKTNRSETGNKHLWWIPKAYSAFDRGMQRHCWTSKGEPINDRKPIKRLKKCESKNGAIDGHLDNNWYNAKQPPED
jgi:hypothetical protein